VLETITIYLKSRKAITPATIHELSHFAKDYINAVMEVQLHVEVPGDIRNIHK
jgi:hypothetical protein